MSKQSLTDTIKKRRAKERGAVVKPPGDDVTVCVVYPNRYSVGMSSLGYQGVYALLNSMDGVRAERAFLPDEEEIREYERTGAPVMSIESATPLGSFDIVAFSVSFENDFVGVAKVLSLTRMPLRSDERKGKPGPMVIAGGIAVSSNPEPLAPFVDIAFIGEAEEMLPEFMRAYMDSATKDEALMRANDIPGLYVPSFYDIEYDDEGYLSGRRALGGAPERIIRRRVEDISQSPVRHLVMTPEAEFSDMRLVEVMRGCPWSCAFCLAGHLLKPVRKKPLEALKAELAAYAGERVGLIAPSLSDYAHLEEVLAIEGVEFSITSVRATEKGASVARLLRNRKSMSIAPEAGTERLRRVINKKVTEDDILAASRAIYAAGVERLRLYFVIGLPSETDEDIEGIIHLSRKVKAIADGAGGRRHLHLTLSIFVPKPRTPFERMPMTHQRIVRDRIGMVKSAFASIHRVSVSHDPVKGAYLQGMLSQGDRRAADVIEAMLREPDYRRAAESVDIDPDFYILRPKLPGEPLPWDMVGVVS